MNKFLPAGMQKAAELTRSGNLRDATALIQSLLQGGGAPEPVSDDPLKGTPSEPAIEGTYTRLDDTPQPDAAATPRPRAKAQTARTSLKETLRKIAAGGMPQPGPTAHTGGAEVAPSGAAFLSLTHTAGRVSRDYRLYVPARRSEAPMPLIVMLHGCTQSPEDFAAGTGMNGLAEEFGCIIAYPAQPSGANAQKCWNWFRPEDQERGRGEPELIAGMTRDILRDHPVDPAQVYIAGLSAGGAAAVIMAAAYPELFTAVCAHSGLPLGAASDIPSAFSAMRGGASGRVLPAAIPTIVFHGLADGTVHPGNGTAIMDRAVAAQTGLTRSSRKVSSPGRRTARQTRHQHADGRVMAEHWEIEGAGHAWSGGKPQGSYTDPEGPDASREMVRFFLQHRHA